MKEKETIVRSQHRCVQLRELISMEFIRESSLKAADVSRVFINSAGSSLVALEHWVYSRLIFRVWTDAVKLLKLCSI